MARGLKVPMGVDITGGAAWVDGEKNDRKTIFTALGDCDSENAFQQELGLGIGMIFDPSDETVRAKILRRLKSIFRVFEEADRYRLLTETISWTEGDGELTLEFKYRNLETDEERSFAQTFE
ncbi:hypothetical protein LCGC14_1329070 [marine sediment metagenome]|uniref:IraD/Gp25-like domain-containing protein n=1 Tax=marine sediment metagenome TaxID=412755 RepID=A0A0F9MXZ5_9ZZZZ